MKMLKRYIKFGDKLSTTYSKKKEESISRIKAKTLSKKSKKELDSLSSGSKEIPR